MKLILVGILFCFQTSFGQADSTLYFKEFGWTVKLPADLKIIDAKITAEQQRKGIKLMESTIDKKIDSTDNVLLISAGRDKVNFFAANYSNSKEITEKNYDSTDKAVKEIFYRALRSNIPGNMDTASSIIVVDGIQFNKFHVNISINDKTKISTGLITSLLRNYYWSLTYVYTDSGVGREIEKMFMESKFER
jgi:hypothetical protein